MRIAVNVATETGWRHFAFDAPEGSDLACYLLPRHACRAEFWSAVKGGEPIPAGRALVWEVEAGEGIEPP